MFAHFSAICMEELRLWFKIPELFWTRGVLGLCQLFTMKPFAKIIKGFLLLINFAKSSVVDLWKGTKPPLPPLRFPPLPTNVTMFLASWKRYNEIWDRSMYKKWSFLFRVSSVNVTKPVMLTENIHEKKP